MNGNGTFTADGTLDSTQYNSATLALNGVNTLTYNNLLTSTSNGFNYLTVGQSSNTTTLGSLLSTRNRLTIGSGTLTGSVALNLRGASPLSFDPDSRISIDTLMFNVTSQTIPALTNGFDCDIVLTGNPITVTQTGAITINGAKSLYVNGNTTVTRVQTWKTDGYNLTVGGDLQIGAGSDSGLKKLDATNYTNLDVNAKSTITVGGNWLNYGTSSNGNPSQFVAATSTVVFNSTAVGKTVTSGATNSPFYNVQFNGTGGAWTLQDNLVATGALTHTAGTLSANGKNITTTGNLTISDGALMTAAGLAGSTVTVGGNFSAAGHSGALLTLNPASTWYLNVTGTANASYVNADYSNASGGVMIMQTNSTDGGNNTNWGFDTTAPTTTPTAGAYTLGTWTSSSSVSVTLACADNVGGVGCDTGYPKYCLDTLDTCNPVTAGTVYTVPITVATESASYIRYYSADIILNAETVKSSTIQIDTTKPVTTADAGAYEFDTWSSSNVTVTLSCGDAGGSGCLATLYCQDTTDECTPNLSYSPVEISTDGTSYIRYLSTDAVANAETVKTQTIKIDITGNQGVSSSSSSSSSSVATGGGGPMPNPPPAITPAPAPSANILEQIAQQLVNLRQQVQNLNPFVTPESARINYPPIAESVPIKAPVALQGWDVMEVKPLSQLSLTPINSSISFFADRIPAFRQALTAFGINVNSLTDAQKIGGTELYLPGLTKVALSPTEILAINKFEPAQKLPATEIGNGTSSQKALENVGTLETNKLPSGTISQPEISGGAGTGKNPLLTPGTLAINNFAAVQGVPLADMSSQAKQKIPTDIVFVRDSGELIDYSVAISVDKAGQVQQKINTVAGKTMQLVIKPDSPAASVTGYMTLNKIAVGKTQTNILASIGRFFTASLVQPAEPIAPTSADGKALLLTKFTYVEKTPGIYVASVTVPQSEGQYDISTVIQYKDINLAPKETKMTAIVNPEGYVYSQMADGRLRIEGASISLYWLNTATKQFELWPASKFLQKNPILTDNTGKYSFLVPEGTYKVKAQLRNYGTYESDAFVMKEDIMVNKDIELFKKTGWFSWLNWQVIITILLIILIAYNIWEKVEQKRKNKNN